MSAEGAVLVAAEETSSTAAPIAAVATNKADTPGFPTSIMINSVRRNLVLLPTRISYVSVYVRATESSHVSEFQEYTLSAATEGSREIDG